MSLILLGILNSQVAGGIVPKYFIGLLNTPDDYSNENNTLDIDSNGDFAFVGSSINNSKVAGWIQKISRDTLSKTIDQIVRDGTQNYQRQFRGVAFDPNDPTVCYVATESGFNPAIIKFDSNGSIVWAKEVGSNGGRQAYGVAVDNSGNPILVGNDNAGTGSGQVYIVKYNSSGSYSWQRALTFSSGASNQRVAVDSNNNIIVAAGAYDSRYKGLVAKYNSSGTLQWQNWFDDGTQCEVFGVATDNSGNIFVSGRYYPAGADGFVAKINSSGSLQWQKRILGDSGATDMAWRCATDSSGNVYVSGEYPDGASRGYVVKFDSSGNTIFQRRFYVSSVTTRAHDVKIAPDGAIYLRGIVNEDSWVAALPNDGSLTGQYTVGGRTFRYESSSFSISNSSMSYGSSNGSDVTRTSTSANFNNTATTSNYGWSTLEI